MQKKGSKIELANVADMLMSDIGSADVFVSDSRKQINTAISGYNEALGKYSTIMQTATKYLDMAKSLGDDNMINRLTKIINDCKEMVRLSNTAINKLKSSL